MSTQTDTCPLCSRSDCTVRECYRQATRTEPRQFLGLTAYCPDCKVGFSVQTPQLVLSVAS